jgi:iron complex outermembrane recepter protein
MEVDARGRVHPSPTGWSGQPDPSECIRARGTPKGKSSGHVICKSALICTQLSLMRQCFFSLFIVLLSLPVLGQVDTLQVQTLQYTLPEVVVPDHWSSQQTPGLVANLRPKDLKNLNFGPDLPYLLRLQPSVVETSDAGTGVGYTGMRIRGSDQTRINVTLNGVPINDPESHNVFWVNMPDLGSSAQQIQVQRGVGPSSYGGGAFGGSVHITTNQVSGRPTGAIETAMGSFGTFKQSLIANTGLHKNGLTATARISFIQSNGFIDRAASNLGAGYAEIGKISSKQSFRLIALHGQERTYQAWYGLPIQYAGIDSLRTYNVAGQERAAGPYANQVDDYRQSQVQGHWYRHWNKVSTQFTAYWVRGFGFYEEYKADQLLYDYGFGDVKPDVDLVRRRGLDNHLPGMIGTASWYQGRNLFTVSVAGNTYLAKHFGRIISLNDTLLDTAKPWYDLAARKTDLSSFIKVHRPLNDVWKCYADLQWRHIRYQYEKIGPTFFKSQNTDNQTFINPKAGISRQTNHLRWYATLSMAHREPIREDYIGSSASSRPKPEQLTDFETGFTFSQRRFELNATLFYMYYRDQMVLTGRLNDVGAYTRVNVPVSMRRGVEIEAAWQPHTRISVQGALAFNDSRIKQFDEYVDNWSTGEQLVITHKNAPIAFSPRVVAHVQTTWQPLIGWPKFTAIAKHIGPQFLDNTGHADARLAAYTTVDALIAYKLPSKNVHRGIELSLNLVNLTDLKYASNGWVYRFDSPGYDPRPDDAYAMQTATAGRYQLKGVFPQAGKQGYLRLRVSF